MKSLSILVVALLCASCANNVTTKPIAFEKDSRAVLAAAAQDTSGPQMFFTPSGHLYLLAGVKHDGKTGLELFVSRNDGDSFGKGITVAPPSFDVMTMGEMSPVLVEDPAGPSMDVLYEGANGKLYFSKASLFAHKFPKPAELVKKAVLSSNGFATMALSPGGVLYVAWLDGRASDRNPHNTVSLYVTRSLDHGKTFEKPVRVDRLACPCCRPALAFNGDGSVVVAWRKDFPGNYRDIEFASSKDGAVFSSPVRVAQDGWSLNGCPDSGPALKAQGRRLYVVWYTQGATNVPQIKVAYTDDLLHFSQPYVASSNTLDANHPRFVAGAPEPLLVFQGREAGNDQWSPVTAFVTTIGPTGSSKPVAMPLHGGSIADPIAVMRDAQSFFVVATAEGAEGSQIVLLRGRM